MLEDLDRIDWTKLQCAYGTAESIPKLLRAVTSAKDARDVAPCANVK